MTSKYNIDSAVVIMAVSMLNVVYFDYSLTSRLGVFGASNGKVLTPVRELDTQSSLLFSLYLL
jgi:hypothetical protein